MLASALIDHLARMVNPVVPGSGPALFAHLYDARTFVATASTAYRSGVVIAGYRRA